MFQEFFYKVIVITSNVYKKQNKILIIINNKGDRIIRHLCGKINVYIAAIQELFSEESLELLLEVRGLIGETLMPLFPC